MPNWEKWKKIEPARLACYINPEVIVRIFHGPAQDTTTLYDLRSQDRRRCVEALYEHLSGCDLKYETAQIDFGDFHEAEQVIRTPHALQQGAGNCLELSLLFAGLCEAHHLRPLLVLLDGHALVAVWLGGDVEQVIDTGRPAGDDFKILSRGVIADARGEEEREEVKRELVQRVIDGKYLPMECTGLARSETVNGPHGRLTFEEAQDRGERALKTRALLNLVDVAYLHRYGLYSPYPVPEPLAQSALLQPPARLGEQGITELSSVLAALTPPPQMPTKWDQPDLRKLSDALTTFSSSSAKAYATRVLANLDHALAAVSFLRAWIPQALTTVRLKRALLATLPPNATSGCLRNDIDYLERIALKYPAQESESDCSRHLVSFVLRLALEAGIDIEDGDLASWAYTLVNYVTFNDLRALLREQRAAAQHRLLISLDESATGRWPESIQAWLFDGRDLIEKEIFPCQPVQGEVERAVGDAVDWAADLVEDENVRRIDIAVPTALLLLWRPEEAKVPTRLDEYHDVTVRWSERLHPFYPRRMLRDACDRLSAITTAGNAALDWLAEDDVRDQDKLADRLNRDFCVKGIGLRFLPTGQEHLLGQLLAFSPILLWPDRTVNVWDEVEQEISERWVSLPSGFAQAYRQAYRQRLTREEGTGPALASLRAVWDDRDWLDFCKLIRKQRADLPLGGQG